MLVELLSDKDNVAITGNKFLFPVKEYDDAGNFTTYSENYALIKLYQLKSKFNRKSGFVNDEERYFSQLGTKLGLTALLREIADFEKGLIEGKLVAQEYVESEIPEGYDKIYFNNKDVDPKERYRKRSGKGGDYLTHKGEQIFRFISWEFDDDVKDILLEHDL